MNDPNIATLYHEACHAAVAAILGRNIETCIVDGLGGGETRVNMSWNDRGQAEDVGAILVAGAVGESLFCGESRPTEYGSDFAHLAEVAALAGQDLDSFSRRSAARATATLQHLAPFVHRIAAALGAERSITASHASLRGLAAAGIVKNQSRYMVALDRADAARALANRQSVATPLNAAPPRTGRHVGKRIGPFIGRSYCTMTGGTW